MYRGFNHQQLEKEYSPSSCVDDIMVYINQYIDISKQNLEVAQTQEAIIENIAYGVDADEVLDLYLPFADTKWRKKLHVYIHGGYWQELSKNESSFAANNFQSHGCHFAVINYSLAPKASMSEIVEQNRKALTYLYENAERLGYDKDQIYVSGSSAGAHLAAMMLVTKWQERPDCELPKDLIKGVCAVSGIYDLEPIALTYVDEPLKLTSDSIFENSPIHHSFANLAPIIFAYGDNETSEFKRQTDVMYNKLKNIGLPVEFGEIERRNHFDVIMDLGQSDTKLFTLVANQMGLID